MGGVAVAMQQIREALEFIHDDQIRLKRIDTGMAEFAPQLLAPTPLRCAVS